MQNLNAIPAGNSIPWVRWPLMATNGPEGPHSPSTAPDDPGRFFGKSKKISF